MWDCCFEKVEMINEEHKGSGCLLAHCMGLGKTLQIVTLVHTLLTHTEITKVKKVLILMPVNVLHNWKHEFFKWTKHCKEEIQVYEVPNEGKNGRDLVRSRIAEMQDWYDNGGVLLIGYTLFARLAQGQFIKQKKFKAKFEEFLLRPGADLVICDEGHVLKTEKTSIAKAVCQVETLRRVVLTGTPLQNNLVEYHCMVSFVKPSLLGTLKEFKNRFANPINNGQHRDSTEADVRCMKKRAHILHNLLDGCVQRKDYSVIRGQLPAKCEYVVSVRLSPRQVELYRKYLVDERGIENVSNIARIVSAQLFTDFQVLSRIWTHPWMLRLNEKRVQKMELKALENDFINDDEDEADSDEMSLHDDDKDDNDADKDDEKQNCSKNKNKHSDVEIDLEESTNKKTTNNNNFGMSRYKSRLRGAGVNDLDNKESENFLPENGIDELIGEVEEQRWWTGMVPEECEYDLSMSGKLFLLERIIDYCEQIGDKLLVFSQNLLALDLIEKFLNFLSTKSQSTWKLDVDYFRLDGSTDINKRKNQVNTFNDAANLRARLFLISTKAGGIGINLVGANRCIIFDASWNPSHDTQSIFRVYRFGQEKEVFVYRFLAQGTMEEKIYQRQVNKQSLSQRVVDEHQLERHFTSQELKELYTFEPDIWSGESGTIPNLPRDDLLKHLLLDCKQWIFKYHEHDSLLENKLDQGLSEEERRAAWDEYEAERNNKINNRLNNVSVENETDDIIEINAPVFNNDMRTHEGYLQLLRLQQLHQQQQQMQMSENFLTRVNSAAGQRHLPLNPAQIQQLRQQQQQQQQELMRQRIIEQTLSSLTPTQLRELANRPNIFK